MSWWPFKRRQVPDQRKVTWIEFLDAHVDDPTGLKHRLRMDWIYLNVGKDNYTYTSEEDEFYPGRLRLYGFYDRNYALMFKLAWGGQ